MQAKREEGGFVMVRTAMLALFVLSAVWTASVAGFAEDPTAEEVLERTRAAWQGESFHGIAVLDVTEGAQTRSYRMEIWTEGEENALLRILEPEDQAGSGYLMTGDVENARRAAERLAAASPESLAQILDHGNTFFANNDFPMARALLEVYTESDPSQPAPYFALGVSCNALGDGAAARAAFARFLELAPPDHPDRVTAEEMLAFLQ